jgi:hypothetical protein
MSGGSAKYREELREAVRSFSCGGQACSPSPGTAFPKHINIYLFGPQGSGKTSFIRTCFRALYGPKHLDKGLEKLEESLHRSDDGTSMYSVYSLTEHIMLHDTRGQREYTDEELAQLRLVLEGRARPNSLIQQRRRYWLLLREFWRSDDQMRRTFSRQVMLSKASLDTEPHFSFLVLDPNQQELLLEDEDFRQCYGSLIGDFSDRGVPHALLCTHGDTMTPKLRSSLLCLPDKLGCRHPKVQDSTSIGPGGVVRPSIGSSSVPFSAPTTGGSGKGGSKQNTGDKQQRMPDIVRIVTNYVDGNFRNRAMPSQVKGTEKDQEGNDVQQDIHLLLVLLDALRQADNQVVQRVGGTRLAPLPEQAEIGCPIL